MAFIEHIYRTMNELKITAFDTVPMPKDITAQRWLSDVLDDFVYLRCKSVNADRLIDFLADERDYIAGYGK